MRNLDLYLKHQPLGSTVHSVRFVRDVQYILFFRQNNGAAELLKISHSAHLLTLFLLYSLRRSSDGHVPCNVQTLCVCALFFSSLICLIKCKEKKMNMNIYEVRAMRHIFILLYFSFSKQIHTHSLTHWLSLWHTWMQCCIYIYTRYYIPIRHIPVSVFYSLRENDFHLTTTPARVAKSSPSKLIAKGQEFNERQPKNLHFAERKKK